MYTCLQYNAIFNLFVGKRAMSPLADINWLSAIKAAAELSRQPLNLQTTCVHTIRAQLGRVHRKLSGRYEQVSSIKIVYRAV